MESLILQSPTLHTDIVAVQPTESTRPTKHHRLHSISAKRDSTISWGRRHHHGSWMHALGTACIMLLCPCLVAFIAISLSHFDGSLEATMRALLESGAATFFKTFVPGVSVKITTGYLFWILFQAGLYHFLPSKLSTGQLTPAGYLLQYRTNGLLAWLVTHILFAISVLSGILDPAIIARHWNSLLVVANVFGFLLSVFVYYKAHMSPTHEGDRKFSGSIFYDIYMGVELNPRFGKLFDFKLFTNGRPGIVAWTLIDFSFIAYQYQLHGYITYSILVATTLHFLYVVDFFVNEDWYLRTIDICHDHFGFYLAWGSVVWLPAIYTLQTQYLARNPVALSSFEALTISCTGITGYIVFRWVNHQKDLVRRTNGKCILWGSSAEVIRVKYSTKDGLQHDSILLCSGWWGLARHVNYLGDLILSYSMCATCGFENLLPWTYALFMTVLLIHRCWRDEERCSKKYGSGWETYCQKVKWVIVPGIY